MPPVRVKISVPRFVCLGLIIFIEAIVSDCSFFVVKSFAVVLKVCTFVF